MQANGTNGYHARMARVLAFIDAHLGEDLPVERLGEVAGFSHFHFHRLFSAWAGMPVGRYIQLRRMKRAAYRLAFRPAEPLIEIAFDSGYESPEAFGRAFRKLAGETPARFRQAPDWDAWRTHFEPLATLGSRHMPFDPSRASVTIADAPTVRVAALEHRGSPATIHDSIRRFIAWRREAGLPPPRSATYNILHDDPDAVPPAAFRMDLCAAIDGPLAANAHGVVEKTIEGGRVAVLRHVGTDDTLGDAIAWLYRQWLPASGEETRDFPLHVQRVRFFPDVPENEAVTDVFLPLSG